MYRPWSSKNGSSESIPVESISKLSSLHISISLVVSTFYLSLWHSGLGHASSKWVHHLASSGQLRQFKLESFDFIHCQFQFGKQTTLPFSDGDFISMAPFNLVHIVIWGPAPTTTMGATCYFIIFVVDFFSHYTWTLQHRLDFQRVYICI